MEPKTKKRKEMRLTDWYCFCFDISQGSESYSLSCLFLISIFNQGAVSTLPRTEIFDFRSVLIHFLFFFFSTWRSKHTARRQGPRHPAADVTIFQFLSSRGRKLWLIAKTRQDTKKWRRKKTALQQSLDDSLTRRRLWFRQQSSSSTYQTKKKKRSLESSLSTTFGGIIKKKNDRKGSCERSSHFTTEWRDFVTAAH